MRKRIGRHGLVSGVLVVSFFISCAAMQAAFRSSDRQLTGVFAVCCGILCICSTLSIFLQAVRYVERKRLKSSREYGGAPNAHLEYCATYSLKNRVVFSLLTAVAASFAWLTYAQSEHNWEKVLISALLVFCAVTLYRYSFTKVWFTNKLIIAEVSLFTKRFESYETVTAMRAQRGNLRLEFEDGMKLNLPSGLGDSARIAAILEKHVEIWPESGESSEKSPTR